MCVCVCACVCACVRVTMWSVCSNNVLRVVTTVQSPIYDTVNLKLQNFDVSIHEHFTYTVKSGC